MKPRRRSDGFSLLEFAVVLAIAGFVLGAVVAPVQTQLEQRDRAQTEQALADIKEAIVTFAIIEGYLPCPDCPSLATAGCNAVGAVNVNDGRQSNERDINGVCRTPWGLVPWRDLGVVGQDAWGNRFRYGVAIPMADSTPGDWISLDEPFPVPPYLSVRDREAGEATGRVVADRVAAVVISRGANAAGRSPDEQENLDENNVYVHKGYTGLAGQEFDDQVVWLSRYVLKHRLVQAGRLP